MAFPIAVLARQFGRFKAELTMPDLEPFFLDAVVPVFLDAVYRR